MSVPARYLILGITVIIQMAASVLQQGVGSIQPLIATRLKLDHEHVGFIVAAISAGSAAFAAIAGLTVDYFGERTVILWSGMAMGVALCAAAMLPNLIWLVAWLFLFGMAYGTSSPAGGRAILLWFTKDRGLAMGIRQTGVPLGGFFGALLLPVIALRWGYQAAFVVAGIICIVVTAVSVLGYRRPEEELERQRQTLPEVWQGMLRVSSSWSSICVNLMGMTLVAAQFTALSFLALATITLKHAPLAVAAAAMAVFQIGAIVGRLFWGALSDRLFRGDRMAPMLSICVIASAALLWLSNPGYEPAYVIFAIAGILGLSAAAWNGLFAAVQAEIGGRKFAGSALGAGFTIIYVVGAVVPPFFGALVDRTNFSIAWQLLAAVVALGVVPGLFARRLLYGRQAS